MTDHDEYAGKSRSQKKRESTAAQKVGEALVALSAAQLMEMDVPDELAAAIRDWREFPSREAKRRQMQYIGRVMRELDLEELQARLERLLLTHGRETRLHHQAEERRDALLSMEDEGLEPALAALVGEYPSLALPRLRHLARAAREEREKKRPPRSGRELYRYLLKAFQESRGE